MQIQGEKRVLCNLQLLKSFHVLLKWMTMGIKFLWHFITLDTFKRVMKQFHFKMSIFAIHRKQYPLVLFKLLMKNVRHYHRNMH